MSGDRGPGARGERRGRRTAALLGTTALVVLWPSAVPAMAVAAPTVPQVEEGCLPAPAGADPERSWPQRQLDPQRAWALTRGEGVLVAVVDTGVDSASPQLDGRVLGGVDLLAGGAADTDCFGHGTFVAGILAAAPATGSGFAGVAPGVTILPIRVATDDRGSTVPALVAGIRTAVDRGASVINVSASTAVPDQALTDAIRYAEDRDVVVIAAAGNESGAPAAGGPASFPASLPTVVAVGALAPDGQPAAFSPTAPYLDLLAPGAEVVSIGPRGPGHWRGSGTSYAAPFVAGVAALVRAYRPQLSAAQVRRRLEVTADHPAAALPDPRFGWGTVDPLAAVATELPEETAAGAADGPGAPGADAPPQLFPDRIGPVLVWTGMGVLVLAAGLAKLVAVLAPAGWRRRWRPARTVRLLPDEPAAS